MRVFITIAILMNLASYANAQTVTRPGLAPGSTWSFTRSPTGVTVSREGTHFSFSRSVGTGANPTAAASATATDPHFAYASAHSSASVVTNGERPKH